MKTLQDFLKGGRQSGEIELWDNVKQQWQSAGRWDITREDRSSIPASAPLVTFSFAYHEGYAGPAISPELLPPKGFSGVVATKGPDETKPVNDRVANTAVPAILRQLTHGTNRDKALEARLMGDWALTPGQDSLPASSGVEQLVMNGGVTLAGFRMTVDDGPMNYLPVMGAQAIVSEADALMGVVMKGDLRAKINFFADKTRNMFAHTALGGATSKFLGYAEGNVLVVKPVLKHQHAESVVEHLMQQAQREAGINAARTRIVTTPEGNTALMSGHFGYDKPISATPEKLPDFAIRRTACSMAAITQSVDGRLDMKKGTYTMMVSAIHQHSSQPQKDREELARRAIFNLMVNNTDNHLGQFEMVRNERNEWALSPSYDVAPRVDGGRADFFQTPLGGLSSQHHIETLDNPALWKQLSQQFADEKGTPMPTSQLKEMAVNVAKAVLMVPDKMRASGLPEKTVQAFVSGSFWDEADSLRFIQAHDGPHNNRDNSLSC